MSTKFHQLHTHVIRIALFSVSLTLQLQIFSMILQYEHIFINNENDHAVYWYTKVVDPAGRITNQQFWQTQYYAFDPHYQFNKEKFESFTKNPIILLSLIQTNKNTFELSENEALFYESHLTTINQSEQSNTTKERILKFLYLNPHREAIFSSIIKNSLEMEIPNH